MKFRGVKDGFLVRLEKGDKVVASLTEFVKQQNIPSGVLLGIGAITDATLGIFDPEKKEYIKKDFKDYLEVGNLSGNISWLGTTGEPFVHLHVTISECSLNAYTGHLFEGTVSVTLEIYIKVFEEKLFRKSDPIAGFNFWQL